MAVKEHNLQGSVLQVQYLSDYKKGETTSRFLDDTLEISNLPADISEEYLQLYFENARSGGCADAVKNISLSAGVARIQFSTAKSEQQFASVYSRTSLIRVEWDQRVPVIQICP